MKIALVHDHIVSSGGGEQLLKVFCDLWPEAPIFTMVHDKNVVNRMFLGKDIRASFLQNIPLSVKQFRWFLPFRPMAVERMDVSGFDVVLSNSSALVKGIITPPETLHINYCHTPTRFLWIDIKQRYDFLERLWPVSFFSDLYKEHRLKEWDKNAASRVDVFIANSKFAQDGIKKYYGADSTIIYPPVNTDDFYISKNIKDFFLIGGRLVPQKKYDIAIRAFSRLDIPLKVFGSGPELSRLKRIAGPNIEFLGRVSDAKKQELMSQARAFIYPQIEDFGITAVESMASGRPVIAYRAGGSLETVIDKETGLFFDDQDWQALAYSVVSFGNLKFDPYKIKKHSEKFSSERFKREIKEFVEQKWELFNR